MLLLRPPGVYPPQEDTWLLADVLRAHVLPAPVRVLDVCTGTGALAVAAALAGAAAVTAVDVGRRAVLTARANAALRGASVQVLRGDLVAPVAGRRFDVVVSNPPYVLSARDRLPMWGMARCFDGGVDGRLVLDRVCAEVPQVLAPGGTLLLVHSALNGVGATLQRLGEAGLSAEVVARSRVPFGPVMRARARLLESRGAVVPGQREEELVVLRAVMPG